MGLRPRYPNAAADSTCEVGRNHVDSRAAPIEATGAINITIGKQNREEWTIIIE